jgi:putative component of membrane protein insertase Oxa1/YidC/SpoIIIJ protein YidD
MKNFISPRLIISLFFIILSFALIKKQKFENKIYLQQRIVSFGVTNSQSKIARYNPLTLSFSGLMYCYQKWLSPQISADCLYRPSCSEYSKQLIKHYGLIFGIITSADRLMRCDRISATSINPISIDDKDGHVHEAPELYSIKE